MSTAHPETLQPTLRILVVVYNNIISRSETIASLAVASYAHSGAKLTIWDNGPGSNADEDTLSALRKVFAEVEYIAEGRNVILSRVYNDIVSRQDADIYVIFDQDTDIPGDYFDVLAAAWQENPDIGVFLPVVRSGDKIVSPGNYALVKGRHWRGPRYGRMPAGRLTAIASGMCISAVYLQRVPRPFDEALSFYGIDTAFMLRYRSTMASLVVMPIVLTHDSAMWGRDKTARDEADALKRFRNLRAANVRIHRGTAKYPLAVLYAMATSVVTALRRRNVRYLLVTADTIFGPRDN